MSEILTSLCSVLLREYFGDIVQQVGTFLLKQVSSCPLFFIRLNVSLPLDKVKSSLCVLIQHNFCDFAENERGFVEYTMGHESVLRLLHYERYAYCSQLLFGDPADLLVEEILNNGKLTMSEAIQKVVERLQDAKDTTGVDYSSAEVCHKFKLLIENHYLIRCPYLHSPENGKVPNLSISEKEMFIVPEIKLHLLEANTDEEQAAKRQKVDFPDSEIYWRINYDRFQQFFRDEAIISACSNHFDEKSADVVRAILNESDLKSKTLSPTTNPVQYYDIVKRLTTISTVNSQELGGLLVNLCEGTRSFVSKADDRGNGMYVVNIDKVLKRIVEEIAASVVRDGFGSKCARIFRILLDKKVLEPKQIEELAMLHPKDTKEYIFKMIEENYIFSHELPKGSDFMHGQIFYLLRIDMVQVCRMLLERCYQALFNLITCSEAQYQENKRLLEKKQRIDAIVASLKINGADEEQIEEVQQIISQPEEAVITKVTHVTQKIDSSQIQLAEMISILGIWLDYTKIK
ncbi:DNA-directed RNA polymerase III subunit RPC3 [Trichonephila inaurata madagascariensis]|uniref:DNA-directed RNA polymerase III subunit RPC3 n=1 Tax=Trichonephila inaurata madagascariensis TaxID=2747483 RepID=A0A8X7CMC6_9ARAC|nr:DNA-directed RNA polymerase III subunit RPC3 [Trichonephila inaurata madagascariensis]